MFLTAIDEKEVIEIVKQSVELKQCPNIKLFKKGYEERENVDIQWIPLFRNFMMMYILYQTYVH